MRVDPHISGSVATQTRGLDGYLTNHETALLVEPGNYLDLRKAIRVLLEDPGYRMQLARRAFDAAGRRTAEDYIARVKALVLDATEDEVAASPR